MFNWIAKRMLGGELDSDLKGLNSLPAMTRLRTALAIVERLEKGMDLLDEGRPLLSVQQAFQQTRREAVSSASGYDDPKHLIGSLPDHFFGALSDSYSTGESATVCRTIYSAIKKTAEEDGRAAFDKQDAKNMLEMIATFEKRLVLKRIL